MKRKIEVDQITVEGVKIKVTFSQHPKTWPKIKAMYTSMGGGLSKHGCLEVISPSFGEIDDALKWVHALTIEVKKLFVIERSLIQLFKDKLEGEEEV